MPLIRQRASGSALAALVCAVLAAAAPERASGEQPGSNEADRASRPGEGIERIGIDRLVEVTVIRSPGLARARASAGIARAEERVVRGRDDWQFEVAIDGSRTARAPVTGQPVQLVSQARASGRADLVRDLPTGGQLRFQVGAARIQEIHQFEQFAMGGATSVPQQSTASVNEATGRVVLNHSILRGFGPSIARADRKQAEIRSSAAVLRARVSAGELTRDIMRSYWELAHAALALEIRRTSLTSVRKLQSETEKVVREGGRPTSDLKVAEYTVAVREESTVRAEIAFEEQSLVLRKLAGLEIGGGEIALWPEDLPGVGSEQYALGQLVTRGLDRNFALAALALDDDDAAIEVKVARDGVKPRLDFTVSAGTTSVGNNVDEAFRGLGEGGNIDASAGLVFSLELGANAARGRRDAALLRHQSVRIEREELRREIASAVVLAVHQIRAAQKRAEVGAKAIELAKANLAAERALFRVGRSSTHQLFEQQDKLDDARLSRVRAVADYHQAVALLQSLTGDILKHYRIDVIE